MNFHIKKNNNSVLLYSILTFLAIFSFHLYFFWPIIKTPVLWWNDDYHHFLVSFKVVGERLFLSDGFDLFARYNSHIVPVWSIIYVGLHYIFGTIDYIFNTGFNPGYFGREFSFTLLAAYSWFFSILTLYFYKNKMRYFFAFQFSLMLSVTPFFTKFFVVLFCDLGISLQWGITTIVLYYIFYRKLDTTKELLVLLTLMVLNLFLLSSSVFMLVPIFYYLVLNPREKIFSGRNQKIAFCTVVALILMVIPYIQHLDQLNIFKESDYSASSLASYYSRFINVLGLSSSQWLLPLKKISISESEGIPQLFVDLQIYEVILVIGAMFYYGLNYYKKGVVQNEYNKTMLIYLLSALTIATLITLTNREISPFIPRRILPVTYFIILAFALFLKNTFVRFNLNGPRAIFPSAIFIFMTCIYLYSTLQSSRTLMRKYGGNRIIFSKYMRSYKDQHSPSIYLPPKLDRYLIENKLDNDMLPSEWYHIDNLKGLSLF